MKIIHSLLTVLICSFVVVACCPCPEPPDGGGGAGGGDVDPHPPVVCDGPGEALAGDGCETDCDCCGLACAVVTAEDGAMSKVCAAPCPLPVGH
jgi:hypothetical protein